MRSLFARYIARHEPRKDWRVHFRSALAAGLAVMLIGWLSVKTGLPLLLAPLGPTAMLIFGQPASAGAQPINIFAGYLIGTIFAVLVVWILPDSWWLATLGVGFAMLVMLVLRVTHPPAVAVPLLLHATPVDPLTLFAVLFFACTLLVGLGVVLHRLPPRQRYPLPLSDQTSR
ncbi:HPP family protein [Pelagibacterium sp. H642]|uniref:HPP family protein n=1 Tax=Pelagibacterium sp. H642 TaxID=1881069 RepID=UPI002815CEFE|nr:HPP family protein [Pelagibacterium sp. H642]WMT90741.1 HPP family protein [Pelagibacterium sp. H642]